MVLLAGNCPNLCFLTFSEKMNLFFSFAHPKLEYPTVAAVGYYATEFLGQTLSYCAVEESRVYTTLPANSLPQLWVTGSIGWLR